MTSVSYPKLYLGADYARRSEMEKYAIELRQKGYEVVSTWHEATSSDDNEFGIGGNNTNVSDGSDWAAQDMEDIERADTFLLFTSGNLSRGGRHTELGMAIALRKRIILVGPREHAFQCLPRITQYDTWDQFLIWHT